MSSLADSSESSFTAFAEELILVALAFTCLAFAVRKMDLAVAYAMWGALGILGTSLGGWLLFNQKIKLTGWLGICVLIGGITLMHYA